jgi:hypothetical protein
MSIIRIVAWNTRPLYVYSERLCAKRIVTTLGNMLGWYVRASADTDVNSSRSQVESASMAASRTAAGPLRTLTSRSFEYSSTSILGPRAASSRIWRRYYSQAPSLPSGRKPDFGFAFEYGSGRTTVTSLANRSYLVSMASYSERPSLFQALTKR